MTSWYLGLSTSGHDPALALVDPAGQVVFAEAKRRIGPLWTDASFILNVGPA